MHRGHLQLATHKPDGAGELTAAGAEQPAIRVRVNPMRLSTVGLSIEDVRAANQRHGVLTEAWSPIAKGAINDDDTIGEIASLVGRTPAQVTLRWHLQRGDIIFPKSMKAERMRENFEIFDFELSAEHVSALDELDRGEAGRTGPNPDAFDYIP